MSDNADENMIRIPPSVAWISLDGDILIENRGTKNIYVTLYEEV